MEKYTSLLNDISINTIKYKASQLNEENLNKRYISNSHIPLIQQENAQIYKELEENKLKQIEKCQKAVFNVCKIDTKTLKTNNSYIKLACSGMQKYIDKRNAERHIPIKKYFQVNSKVELNKGLSNTLFLTITQPQNGNILQSAYRFHDYIRKKHKHLMRIVDGDKFLRIMECHESGYTHYHYLIKTKRKFKITHKNNVFLPNIHIRNKIQAHFSNHNVDIRVPINKKIASYLSKCETKSNESLENILNKRKWDTSYSTNKIERKQILETGLTKIFKIRRYATNIKTQELVDIDYILKEFLDKRRSTQTRTIYIIYDKGDQNATKRRYYINPHELAQILEKNGIKRELVIAKLREIYDREDITEEIYKKPYPYDFTEKKLEDRKKRERREQRLLKQRKYNEISRNIYAHQKNIYKMENLRKAMETYSVNMKKQELQELRRHNKSLKKIYLQPQFPPLTPYRNNMISIGKDTNTNKKSCGPVGIGKIRGIKRKYMQPVNPLGSKMSAGEYSVPPSFDMQKKDVFSPAYYNMLVIPLENTLNTNNKDVNTSKDASIKGIIPIFPYTSQELECINHKKK